MKEKETHKQGYILEEMDGKEKEKDIIRLCLSGFFFTLFTLVYTSI